MVGHKLGEFSPTRQFHGHTPADKKAAQVAESSASEKPVKPGVTTSTTKPKETSNAAKK